MRVDLSLETAYLISNVSAFIRGQQAYLDPGSGSYLLQLLIAGLFGGLFVIRASWDRIRNFFRRRPTEEEEAATDDEQP